MQITLTFKNERKILETTRLFFFFWLPFGIRPFALTMYCKFERMVHGLKHLLIRLDIALGYTWRSSLNPRF